MRKIGFITNIRAPYRTLQFEKISELEGIDIELFYTHALKENRKWEIKNTTKFNEKNLKGIKISNRYGYINLGLFKIIKNKDIILLGGYEQPTYILMSLLCRLYKRPYIIIFDGISTNKIGIDDNSIKNKIKKMVISKSSAIFANGMVGKEYFKQNFNISKDNVYNQYLTVDTKLIDYLYKDKVHYRNIIREKYCIEPQKKVLIYSGRLVEIKNIEVVIEAISLLPRKSDLVFLITGGGELKERLLNIAYEKNVKIIVTDFIDNQEELFKHYFGGDALILPSIDEVWGLVVNEAMAAELPVLVSKICGCSLDLVVNDKNGYTFNPYNVNDISDKINKLFFEKDHTSMGIYSKELINEWNFDNSANEFQKMIDKLF